MRLVKIITTLMIFALIAGCQTTQPKVTVESGAGQPSISSERNAVQNPRPSNAPFSVSLEGINM